MFLVIAGASTPVVAQSVPVRVWHWAEHHKELLLADGLVVGGWYADAAISIRCQHEFPVTCIEENTLVGPHPSEGKFLGYATLFSAGLVAVNHVTWHVMPGPFKHLIWAWCAPTAIDKVYVVNHNANYLEWLESHPTTVTFLGSGTAGTRGPVALHLHPPVPVSPN